MARRLEISNSTERTSRTIIATRRP